MKHTPGPWRYTRVNGTGRDFNIVTVDTGGFIALASSEYHAKLIAAAPELLEALEGLMRIERRGRIMPIGREWDAASAAIAKATQP